MNDRCYALASLIVSHSRKFSTSEGLVAKLLLTCESASVLKKAYLAYGSLLLMTLHCSLSGRWSDAETTILIYLNIGFVKMMSDSL